MTNAIDSNQVATAGGAGARPTVGPIGQPIEASADVVAAVRRLARRLRGADAEVVDLARLTAGASMQTWTLTITSSNGRESLILRRRTAGSHRPIGSDIGPLELRLEAELLRAASAGGVPVAELVHVCDPADGLGQAHLTRRVEGETLGRRIVTNDRFAGVRPGLAGQCGAAIARVHATDIRATGLATDLAFEDASRTLDRYEASYRALATPRPVIEVTLQHLRATVPDPVPPTLVHGDFRNGNLIIDPVAGLVAVLDWELAHLGDPAEDLGYICVNSWRYGATDRPVGGFGTYEQLLDAYRATGGRPIALDRLRYWQLMGSLKWAVICMELFDSWVTGADRSVERPMIGRRVTEAEIDMLTWLRSAG